MAEVPQDGGNGQQEPDDPQGLDELEAPVDDGASSGQEDDDANQQTAGGDDDWVEPDASQTATTIHAGSPQADAQTIDDLAAGSSTKATEDDGGDEATEPEPEPEIEPETETADADEISDDIDGEVEAEDGFESPAEAKTVAIDGAEESPDGETSAGPGPEDSAIVLDIDASLLDAGGSDSLNIVISDVPGGAILSAGTDNGDGTWTLGAGDLDGLTIVPPADCSTDFQLAVTATSTEAATGETAMENGMLDVSVRSDVDAPNLAAAQAPDADDTAIALEIDTGLADTDGAEDLSVVISEVPAGATLSAGADNGDGTWTLSSSDLPGLTITPPADSDVDFTLSVTATSMGADGDTSSASGTIDVSVTAADDDPALDAGDASSVEDTAVSPPEDSGGDVASSEPTPAGDESGAVETSDGENEAAADDKSDGEDGGDTLVLSGDRGEYSITRNANGEFTITDLFAGGGTDIVKNVESIQFNDGIEPAANLLATNPSTCRLDITAALTGMDGAESSLVTVDGVPSEVTLSAGAYNGDGTWTLEPGDLSGLTMLVPRSSDDFQLNVTATSTDGTSSTHPVELVEVDADGSGFGAGDDGTPDDGAEDGTLDGGRDGDDLFIFDSGEGSDHFAGGDGWTDAIENETGLEPDAEASGDITVAEGSELTFDGAEKLEW